MKKPLLKSEKSVDTGGRSRLRSLLYEFPDSTSHAYDVFDLRSSMQGSAGILPIDEQRNIYLVEEFLPALGAFGLSLPRGGIEIGESPEKAALRELKEEAGLSCEKIVPLWNGCIIPNASTWHVHLFAGYGVKEVSRTGGDEFGGVRTVKLPLDEALEQIQNGKMQGSLLALALLLAAKL